MWCDGCFVCSLMSSNAASVGTTLPHRLVCEKPHPHGNSESASGGSSQVLWWGVFITTAAVSISPLLRGRWPSLQPQNTRPFPSCVPILAVVTHAALVGIRWGQGTQSRDRLGIANLPTVFACCSSSGHAVRDLCAGNYACVCTMQLSQIGIIYHSIDK